jgi:membrane protein YdbS with pleckstrin-like domain
LLVGCYSFGRFFLQLCLHLQSNLSTSKTVDIKDNYFSCWWDLKIFWLLLFAIMFALLSKFINFQNHWYQRQMTFATTTTTKMQLWVVVFFCFFSFLFQVCS